MKPQPLPPRTQEIELKLALPTSDPSTLAKRLARTPALARRTATRQHLHNVYYDTPEQTLRRARVALRVRRVGTEAEPQWLQTLKMGGSSDSALSQRGEWETPLSNETLSAKALKATPWSDLDPDGKLFKALVPAFVTSFERTSWQVARRDGSVIEVALDLGQVVAGDKTAAICELELELLSGSPVALFELAQQIARTVAVLPVNTSKAGQGYALAQNSLDRPLQARPPVLDREMPLLDAARRVLREMFGQFTSNLHVLRTSDNPEVVHQARVGWRRFKSALQLFKPVLANTAAPSWDALAPLLICLGELRDLDVACSSTLPQLANAYTAGSPEREQLWLAMMQDLVAATDLQRKTVRYALQEPTVGAALLATTQWLEGIPPSTRSSSDPDQPGQSLRPWARSRMARLHEQFKLSRKNIRTPEDEHRVRLLAKRMRYGLEALGSLLPPKRAQRWHAQAISLQTNIGAQRDVQQAATRVAGLQADRGLVEFLRGVATQNLYK